MDQRTNYAPYHRAEKYPRSLLVDFRRSKPTTLKKYVDAFELNLRPDAQPAELAVAVARHFESHLEVDEDECLGRFMNAARKVPPPAQAVAETSNVVGKRVASQRRTGAGAGGGGDMINTDDALEAAERGDDDMGGALPRTRGAAAQSTSLPSVSDSRQARGAGPAGASRQPVDAAGLADSGALSRKRAAEAPPPRDMGPAAASRDRGMRGPGMDAAAEEASLKRRRVAGAGGVGGGGRAGWGPNGDEGDDVGGGGGAAIVDSSADDGDELYCICRRVSYGEMIGCDNPHCLLEWFHLGCVGLLTTNRPRGKWYCPDCRDYSNHRLVEGDFHNMGVQAVNQSTPEWRRRALMERYGPGKDSAAAAGGGSTGGGAPGAAGGGVARFTAGQGAPPPGGVRYGDGSGGMGRVGLPGGPPAPSAGAAPPGGLAKPKPLQAGAGGPQPPLGAQQQPKPMQGGGLGQLQGGVRPVQPPSAAQGAPAGGPAMPPRPPSTSAGVPSAAAGMGGSVGGAQPPAVDAPGPSAAPAGGPDGSPAEGVPQGAAMDVDTPAAASGGEA